MDTSSAAMAGSGGRELRQQVISTTRVLLDAVDRMEVSMLLLLRAALGHFAVASYSRGKYPGTQS